MVEIHKTKEGHGNAGAEHAQNCSPAPKWAALITDTLFPMPRRKLTARDILDQAGVGQDFVLVRDYGSPNDIVLADDALADLAEGNVFRSLPRCEAGHMQPCTGPAKLAFVCDDASEITLIGSQTGHSLKRLLGLPDDAELLRDHESPNDEPVADEAKVEFKDGPVFTAKRGDGYCINIEGTPHRWNKATITTVEIRKLGNLPSDQQVVCEDAEGRERTLREDEVVTLDPCCRFGRAPKYKRG